MIRDCAQQADEDKQALRRVLSGYCPEQSLRQWFDPLRIVTHPDSRCVSVACPHPLFGRWLKQEDLHSLEAAAHRMYGRDWKVELQHLTGKHVPPLAPVSVRPSRTQQDESDDAAYLLDSFVYNSKNNFPLTILKKTASGEHVSSLLVLHGISGTGKTHLARALGTALVAVHGRDAVFCGTVDDIAAIAAGPNHEAVSFFLRYQVIIVDDIQRLHFFPQLEELVSILIDACLEHKHIFFATVNLAPVEWQRLPQRLAQRLEQALVMVLYEADMDIRLRYAQLQNQVLRLGLNKNQLLTLAQQCTGLRRLIGMLQRIKALKDVLGQDIATQNMDHVLAQTADIGAVTPQQVIRIVADRCNVRTDDMTGHKRQPRIVKARQMAMFLCRGLIGSSYPAIGRVFGGRDHSTVIHSIKKIQLLWDTDKDMHKLLTELSLACRQQPT